MPRQLMVRLRIRDGDGKETPEERRKRILRLPKSRQQRPGNKYSDAASPASPVTDPSVTVPAVE